MKKFVEIIKKVWLYGWAQAGFVKIMGAAMVAAILVVIFRVTGQPIFWKLALFGPGIYIGIYAAVTFIFAWIVWPISEIKKKFSSKK